MPNGDPNFDLDEQEEWFGRIAIPIQDFVAKYGLVLDKYYHDGPSWDLRFGHPQGGNASIQVMNAGDVARLSTVWYLDDYDQFARCLHWREPVDVELDSDSISRALVNELEAILADSARQLDEDRYRIQERVGYVPEGLCSKRCGRPIHCRNLHGISRTSRRSDSSWPGDAHPAPRYPPKMNRSHL